MSQQNLCLICCYSFQEKRSRFISKEASDCFLKFSTELGFPLEPGDKSITENGNSLNLPFGDGITVCGDCLSLVVVYVQRKTIQREKEESLLELQRAVCKAIQELGCIVDDVQCHINRLHSTVRMGDDSIIGNFLSKKPSKQEDVKYFREKVLSLNTGIGKQLKDIRCPKGERILIKPEPRDDEDIPMETFSDNDNDASFRNGENDESNLDCQQESTTFSSTSRNLRTLVKQDYSEPYIEDESLVHEDYSDPDPSRSDKECDLSSGESESGLAKVAKKTDKPKRRSRRRRFRKVRTEGKRLLKYGNILSSEKASKWKDDLFKRVIEQVNNENVESSIEDGANIPTETERSTAKENESEVASDRTRKSRNLFQIVDEQLQLRGILVKVHEKRRMLECMRCYKMYFEERDVTSADVNVETLMRNHILEKHFVVRKKKPPEEMEVIEYTSHTKSRLTFKLACNKRYSYTRRCGKQDAGSSYFRCDFRKGNCSASIVHKDGKYIKLRKGWNDEGFHTVHPPDVERTNRQIALGNAKHMYLTDNSKTIDEVCNIIMTQTDEQSLPISKLKRAMVYSKYGSRGRAPEEKINQTAQCCYCGKIYKEQRGLSRHMKTQHPDIATDLNPGNEEDMQPTSTSSNVNQNTRHSEKSKSPPVNVSSKEMIQKRTMKKNSQVCQEESRQENSPNQRMDAPVPAIVFSDPSVANNFVNRCINAIMQQVGVSMNSNSGSTSGSNRCSVLSLAPGNTEGFKESPAQPSPAPSESSQPEIPSRQHQHNNLLNQNPRSTHSTSSQQNHWQTQPSSSEGHQPTVPGPYSMTGSNSNHVWQWGSH